MENDSLLERSQVEKPSTVASTKLLTSNFNIRVANVIKKDFDGNINLRFAKTADVQGKIQNKIVKAICNNQNYCWPVMWEIVQN